MKTTDLEKEYVQKNGYFVVSAIDRFRTSGKIVIDGMQMGSVPENLYYTIQDGELFTSSSLGVMYKVSDDGEIIHITSAIIAYQDKLVGRLKITSEALMKITRLEKHENTLP